MQIHELTALARQMKASDIHISQGLPLMFRIDGKLVEAPVQFDEDATRALIESTLDESHREALDTQRLDADFAIAAPDGTRSRVNVFYQQGKISATLRLLNDEIPTMEQLGLPPVLKKLADEPRGLILVTGPTWERLQSFRPKRFLRSQPVHKKKPVRVSANYLCSL